MTDPQRRASVGALALVAASVIGYLLALVFQWASTFTLTTVDTTVDADELVSGTVTSIPLPPLVLLVVAALLVRSRRWWGAAAAVVLTLLGVLFTIGGLGEITSENPEVGRAVLVVAGVVWMLLGLSLLAAGGLAVADRVRSGRSATS